MKVSRLLLAGLIALLLVPLAVLAQQPTEPEKSRVPPGMRGSFTLETARVEEVYQVVEEGFRFVAYAVTWHNEKVIVSDPLADSDHAVGEEITFMASRSEIPSSAQPKKTLSFMLFEHGVRSRHQAK